MAQSLRALLPMLLLILLTPCAFALSQNSSAILSFAPFAVPHGQQFSVQPFSLSGSQAFAVASGSVVYGIFVSGLPVLENSPLTAPDELENALAAYYASQGYSPSITFSDVHAGLLSVMANREKGEAKCRILTGTDRTPCTSFESCQKACYSVTSFCLNIALGSGRVFIDEIWKFENSSRALGSAYLDESITYSSMQDGITQAKAMAYLDALGGVNRAATAASKSALFDGYSYCFEPDYALPVITNMQLTAQKRYALSEPFFMLSENAMQVRQRTQAALDASSAQQKDERAAQEAKALALAGQNALFPRQNTSAPPAASPSSDSAAIMVAAAMLVLILAAGAYLFAGHKKKK
ncbi:MAG: hypothetical protein NTX79_07090 [Candidatus Micrarchaeota archaeon]|nr:hypothetical protein [Candidatus Micrarchaeota archaeon]